GSRLVITRCGFGPSFLPLPHRFWITCPQDTLFFRCAVQLRMEIGTALNLRLLLFDGNAMSIGPGILADAGHLPGNLHVGFVRLDTESTVSYLTGHDCLCELADDGELIAEIAVQGFKPLWQGNYGIALRIGDDISVVNVHHVRGFDEGVVEILVGGIERMIDLERTARFREVAVDIHISVEPRSPAGGAACQNPGRG